jgi:hypothetical protein
VSLVAYGPTLEGARGALAVLDGALAVVDGVLLVFFSAATLGGGPGAGSCTR